MKKLAYLLTGILFITVYTAHAQSPKSFKFKSNPAYSVHNYKQPDKAALAKKYNLERLQTFTYVEATPAAEVVNRNYKAQAATTNVSPASGAVIPTSTRKQSRNGLDSPANYKRQAR
ncbi:MAG: hypothetical protein V4714_20080 [Bacteroidota bacterium]